MPIQPYLPPVGVPDEVDQSQKPATGTSALATLFIEHNRSLHSFLRARVGTLQDAEDIAQEAYARLLQLGQPGAIGYLRAYLFKTAAHIAVDRARQQRSRMRLDQGLATEEQVDATTPEEQVHATEQLALLKQALSELPVRYRRAFLLNRFKDLTTEQIAADMQIGECMARRYVCRATQYCKRRLDGLSAADARKEIMS